MDYYAQYHALDNNECHCVLRSYQHLGIKVIHYHCICSGSQGEFNEITPEFIGKMVYS